MLAVLGARVLHNSNGSSGAQAARQELRLYVQNAGAEHSQHAFMHLGNMAQTIAEQGLKSPSIMVIGEVVGCGIAAAQARAAMGLKAQNTPSQGVHIKQYAA